MIVLEGNEGGEQGLRKDWEEPRVFPTLLGSWLEPGWGLDLGKDQDRSRNGACAHPRVPLHRPECRALRAARRPSG